MTVSQAVLSAAQELLVQSQAALNAARTVSRAPGDTSAAATLSKAQLSAQKAASDLQAALNNSAAQVASHESVIEQQRQNILSVARSNPEKNGAAPLDVVKARFSPRFLLSLFKQCLRLLVMLSSLVLT